MSEWVRERESHEASYILHTQAHTLHVHSVHVEILVFGVAASHNVSCFFFHAKMLRGKSFLVTSSAMRSMSSSIACEVIISLKLLHTELIMTWLIRSLVKQLSIAWQTKRNFHIWLIFNLFSLKKTGNRQLRKH